MKKKITTAELNKFYDLLSAAVKKKFSLNGTEQHEKFYTVINNVIYKKSLYRIKTKHAVCSLQI